EDFRSVATSHHRRLELSPVEKGRCPWLVTTSPRRRHRRRFVSEISPLLSTFDQPAKLVDYLYKRTGKQAAVVKQDPPPPEAEKKEQEKAKEGGNKVEGNKVEKKEQKGNIGELMLVV
ncbi:hypothetical protein Dimus_020127, partial [Dionaea muscipula]